MRTRVLPLIIFVVAFISLPILDWFRYHVLLVANWSRSFMELWQIAVTIILLIASFFIILSNNFGQVDRRWAYATVGTILGYWLLA
jgi:hypothetical protein